MLCIGQETSKSHFYSKWHRRTAEKCIDTYSVITIDKGVRKHTVTKSVRTQFDPLH